MNSMTRIAYALDVPIEDILRAGMACRGMEGMDGKVGGVIGAETGTGTSHDANESRVSRPGPATSRVAASSRSSTRRGKRSRRGCRSVSRSGESCRPARWG